MVIMDRQDYINKANSLLNQNTYRSIPWDPTNTNKNKLISILKRVKNQTGLDSSTYKSMNPTGLWSPQDPQTRHSPQCLVVDLSPMVWPRSLPKSSNPWLGSPHTVSIVPKTLLNRQNTSHHIILLLEFCLKNTYFSFQGQFYEQVEGVTMGSPVIPIVANLYMEYLEQKALSSAYTPQVLVQVCGWHLCHPQGGLQTRLPSTH